MSDSFPRKKKSAAYVVWVGRQTGVFTSWQHVSTLVQGFPKARYKGFASLREANLIWNLGFDAYEQGRLNAPIEKNGKLYPKKPAPKKVDPRIKERARMLVSTFTDPKTKTGQHTTSCNAVSCTYPACRCK